MDKLTLQVRAPHKEASTIYSAMSSLPSCARQVWRSYELYPNFMLLNDFHAHN